MNFYLYRGNLHKVPDVPRRWPLSKPSISLQVFQKALVKRQEALNRLGQKVECSTSSASEKEAPSKSGTTVLEEPAGKLICGGGEDNSAAKNAHYADNLLNNELKTVDDGGGVREKPEVKDEEGSKSRDCGKRKRDYFDFSKMETDGADINSEEDFSRPRDRNARIESDTDSGIAKDMSVDEDEKCDEMDCDQDANATGKVKSKLRMGDAEEANCSVQLEDGLATEEISKGKQMEKLEAPRTPDEDCVKSIKRAPTRLDGSLPVEIAFESWKANRKAELEAKLKALQATKHQLVQMLKQVLSEEESKKRAQGLLQFPGAVTMETTDQTLEHKLGSDSSVSADLEEALREVRDPYALRHLGQTG